MFKRKGKSGGPSRIEIARRVAHRHATRNEPNLEEPPIGSLADLRAAGAAIQPAPPRSLKARSEAAPGATGGPPETDSLDLPGAIRAYGEAMLVFAKDPEWNGARLADAHAILAPAARMNQIVIAKVPNAADAPTPVGVAVWAKVDETVDRKLKQQSAQGERPQLAPEEWRSGEIPWLIALGGAPSVREATCQKLADLLGRPALIETFAQQS